MKKLVYVVNVDWFFLSHRLPIALAAQKQGFEIHIATSLTTRLPELLQYGFTVHQLKLDRSSVGPIAAIKTLFSIWTVFKSTKPDLVHLVTIKPVLLGGIAARMAGVPSVVAAISGLGFVFVAQGVISNFWRMLVALAYRLALGHRNLKVIFQNDDDKSRLTRIAGLPETKATMIRGSGVDLSQYAPNPINYNQRIVLFAARLLLDKGVGEFVEAARILRSRNCDKPNTVRFVLVGEPDIANPTSVTAAQLKAWVEEGAVENWGHRSNMPEVLSAASIVTLPSYYGEGLPKVLIEAAACGRAVVTTDHPGCRDAIEPGVSGLLVPVRDAKALANAIQDLLDHPDKCASMGLSGRKLAEQVFDISKVVEAHLRIYEELIAKAAR
jgi:glycosyltransferase involved in cell wall biosynthesis